MQILYEDSDLIIVVKQPGQLSEAADGAADSLITLLNQHFRTSGDAHATAYPIHRLDRNVGGVMVYAKHRRAAATLSAAVQEDLLVKEYLAVVHGTPTPSVGVLEDLLWKDSRKNKTFVVTRLRKGVREAKLAYRVLHTEGQRSLVHIRLYTGRSHQIRVQFATRKWPLIGDGKYGARDNQALALFSCRLTLPHPRTGEVLQFSHCPETLGSLPISETPPPLKV